MVSSFYHCARCVFHLEADVAAIDVWSAGVMLLSMLTLKFPLFNSTDDLEALMEIAAIFGRGAMEKCAMLHSKSSCPVSPQMT